MTRRIERTELVARLRGSKPVVLPSLLFCDFGNLHREIKALEEGGAVVLHLDVMDGHFVPNFTYGLPIVEAVRSSTELPLDVHLMIEKPERYVEQFRAAGADIMTIHAEAVEDPRPLLDKIRALGATAGLSINPPTPVSSIEACLPHCDVVLVMSVMPGFGGQQFDKVALDKLRTLRDRDDVDALLEVDGGISASTIGACADAGAEMFVAGSAIFRADDYGHALGELRSAAGKGMKQL